MLHFDDQLARSCGQVRPITLHVKYQGRRAVSKYIITKPYAIIGRNSSCDICLDHEDVSKQHAYLQVLDGKLFCIDQGSRHGIFWKDTPQLYGWLNPGQCIEIGPYEISLEQPVGADIPTKALRNTTPFFAKYNTLIQSNAHLEINGNRQFPLNHQLALIGRCSHCNVILDTNEISPIHASVVRTHDGKYWLVVPIGIKVRVNGTRCISTELQNQDVITIGNHTLTFQVTTAENDAGLSSSSSGSIKAGTHEEVIQLKHVPPATPAPSLIEIDTDAHIPLNRTVEKIDESELSASQMLSQSNPSGFPIPSADTKSPTTSLVHRQQTQPIVARLANTTTSLAAKQISALSQPGNQDMQLADFFVQQMKQMQQEMMTQMQMNMEMMAKFMVNLQKQHMEMVREEMNHLNKINQELLHLRQSLVTAQPPTIESYRLSINQDAQKPARTEQLPPSSAATTSKAENQDIDKPSKHDFRTVKSASEEPSPASTHGWITQRIAVLEKERTSRWEKMKTAFLGK